MGFLRHLAALLLLLGGVLLPLRAVAATIPTFIVYDGAVRSTATTALGRHDAVRPETERARTAWDDASFAYEALSNMTKDHQEAVNAFREKRPPRFTGE